MGNIVILLSINMNNLTGLWIIPVGLIPQEESRPILIYDYTRSGLNAEVLQQAPC